MTWPGFLVAQGAWLLLLLVPLIIFYFLKLKRPRLDIPSLALWRSVLNDRRVNAPFQKFKRNLLLLLQALLLVCLALAAMQPFWPSGAERARFLPILIDTSASMAALDAPGGQSRLDAAKAEIRRLIDNLLSDQRVSLISVSSTARQLTEFTDNKRVLREALEKLEVSPVASRLEDALRMTQALARTVNIETVVLYTDGNVPPLVDFDLPFQLNYQKLPAAGTNLGITAVNARRAGERWELFVRVEGSGGPPPDAAPTATKKSGEEPVSTGPAATANVQLFRNGKPLEDEVVSLEPGQSQRIVFRVDADTSSSLEVRLKPTGFDSLASDDVAWLDLPISRPLVVYCSPELSSYRHALRGSEAVVTLFPQEGSESNVSSYDLVISDKQPDSALEAGVTLSVGVVPDDLSKLVKVETGSAEVIDWQRSDPLLQHVVLTDVQIADRPISAEGVGDRDYEELGYQIIAQGRTGPLILRRDVSGQPEYFLLFHTDRSTLPFRVGFPILVKNSLELAAQAAGLSEIRGQPAGLLAPRLLKPETSYRITGPDGESVTAKTKADGQLSGVAAPLLGQYVISEDGREAARVGVSLLSAPESSLAAVERLQFKELAVGVSSTMLKSDHPLWPYLAGLGFALLLAEWWFFQRPPVGT